MSGAAWGVTAPGGIANSGIAEIVSEFMRFQDEERRRIAPALHDELGQQLAGFGDFDSTPTFHP